MYINDEFDFCQLRAYRYKNLAAMIKHLSPQEKTNKQINKQNKNPCTYYFCYVMCCKGKKKERRKKVTANFKTKTAPSAQNSVKIIFSQSPQ